MSEEALYSALWSFQHCAMFSAGQCISNALLLVPVNPSWDRTGCSTLGSLLGLPEMYLIVKCACETEPEGPLCY